MSTQASNNQPTLDEIRDSARVISLPLRTKFRGLLEREIMVFEGPHGYTEWSPFIEYDDAEALAWLDAAIEFGWSELPPLQRTSIGVNATLPAVAPDKVESILARFGHFKTVKIKVAEVGQTIDDDLVRVAEVCERYPHAKIRLDANGGYSLEMARAMATAMAEDEVPIEYFEQPVATVEEMARLRMLISSIDIKIAADENIRKAADPLAVARAGAADILVLKAAPLGGIARALDIAMQSQLPAVVSSALDSSIGLSMGAHLAGALPQLNFDCGLGTASLLAGDVTANPLVATDGRLEIRRVEVDRSRLDIFKADDHRADWWFDRLDRVMALRESR